MLTQIESYSKAQDQYRTAFFHSSAIEYIFEKSVNCESFTTITYTIKEHSYS